MLRLSSPSYVLVSRTVSIMQSNYQLSTLSGTVLPWHASWTQYICSQNSLLTAVSFSITCTSWIWLRKRRTFAVMLLKLSFVYLKCGLLNLRTLKAPHAYLRPNKAATLGFGFTPRHFCKRSPLHVWSTSAFIYAVLSYARSIAPVILTRVPRHSNESWKQLNPF